MLHSIAIADSIRFSYDDFHFAGIAKRSSNCSRLAYFVHFVLTGEEFTVQLYQCNPFVPKSWQSLNCANPTNFPLFVRFSSPQLRLRANGLVEIAFLAAGTVTISRRTVLDPYMAIINAFPPLDFCRFLIGGRQADVTFEKFVVKDMVFGDVSRLSLWPSDDGEQWNLAEASMCDVYRLKFEDDCVIRDTKITMPSHMREHVVDRLIGRYWSSFPAVILQNANDVLHLGLLTEHGWLTYIPCHMNQNIIHVDSKFCYLGGKLMISVYRTTHTIRCQHILFDNSSGTYQVFELTKVPFALDFERLIPGDSSTALLVRRDRSVRILFTNVLSLTELCTIVLMKLFGAVKNPLNDSWSGGISESELRSQLGIQGDVLLF